MRKIMIFTFIVVIGFCFTGHVFADDKTSESAVYYDKKTNLEWLAGPDKPTNWYDAKKWVDSLTTVSGGGWRMPTIKELRTLYQKREKCNIVPSLKTSGCWVWSGETKGSSNAWGFSYSYHSGDAYGFLGGSESWELRETSSYGRVFAVRSRR